jgi:RNA polymerase sigma-70 factor (ECF subfamily)
LEEVMDGLAVDSETTRELLRQAREGDAAARDQLFTRHRGYLRRFVELRVDARLRARVDPSDVVQEAQLEALRRLPSYLVRPPLPFRLWLRQIAHDHLRKAHRRHVGAARRTVQRETALPDHSSLLLARRLIDRGPTPSQQLGEMELAQRLRRGLEQLSEADREVLLLRHYEELSNVEVAVLLGVDAGAVSKRHGRALVRLHQLVFGGQKGGQP